MGNTLYFGDNLDILRTRLADESVDLVYLDPPFNSQARYNVLFASPDNAVAAAQAEAFRDTWTWGEESNWAYTEIMNYGGNVARIVDALHSALGKSDMMAYLVMMAVRLRELHQKLKSTGSLYLHCDPTASHYLKIILDSIFGPKNYRNEISWRRSSAHSDTKQGMRRCGKIRDVILFYTKSSEYTWNNVYVNYKDEYLEQEYRHNGANGRKFKESDLTAAKPGGETMYEWRVKRHTGKGERWQADLDNEYKLPKDGWEYKGVLPYRGRYWAYSRDNMIAFAREGRLIHRETGMPRLIQFMDEMQGIPLQDSWDDIPPASGREDTGYPTQKPLKLLKRIVDASSNPGDVILDPFCGCGTTIEAAQQGGRQWIGIDVAVHAIKVIEARIHERLGDVDYQVEGMPRDFASAAKLAERDKYQFQWWANYLFNPHALREQKRGADRGIDGELFFPNGPGRPWGRMLTSVKGGTSVSPAMVRDFRGVLERESAEMGLFITLHRPTKGMQEEAAQAGFAYTAHGDIPRLQIVAIEDWFDNRLPKLPPLEHLPTAAFSTAKRRAATTQKRRIPDPDQPELPLSFKGGQAGNEKRHLNPAMVRDETESARKSA